MTSLFGERRECNIIEFIRVTLFQEQATHDKKRRQKPSTVRTVQEDTAAKRRDDRDTASEVQGGSVDIREDPLEENLFVEVSENLSGTYKLVYLGMITIAFCRTWVTDAVT